ncbi:hypothetical protein ZHAS_00002726 [Anopheles sinensis]|uniref:Uncharacterized protein n=1 Tax=Anopheles sinensis TaxID=74873 RepID=A0A084VCW8_ANOSI|nr:hypothetical protein ZHAS_00002726 [Anopheles sinensis]
MLTVPECQNSRASGLKYSEPGRGNQDQEDENDSLATVLGPATLALLADWQPHFHPGGDRKVCQKDRD